MLLDDAQSFTAFKSNCRLSQSVTSPTPEYGLISSAKLTSLDSDTSWSISEIIIKNRRGTKTVPCMTPLNTWWSSLIPQANVQNEICQLGSETTSTNISSYPNCSEYAKVCHGPPYQRHLKSQDTPCRHVIYYLT